MPFRSEAKYPRALWAYKPPKPKPEKPLQPPRPRSTFYALIGEAPRCKPGDIWRARIYYDKIMRAIERCGWTPSERARLYKLRDRWHARAYGHDELFKIRGNRSGRPFDEEIERAIDKGWQSTRRRKPGKMSATGSIDTDAPSL